MLLPSPPSGSSDEVSLEQESEEDIHSSRSSLDRQSHHRANTTMHVCWYRNTSVSMTDHSVAVEVSSSRAYTPLTCHSCLSWLLVFLHCIPVWGFNYHPLHYLLSLQRPYERKWMGDYMFENILCVHLHVAIVFSMKWCFEERKMKGEPNSLSCLSLQNSLLGFVFCFFTIFFCPMAY